jgi:hypothetical protein
LIMVLAGINNLFIQQLCPLNVGSIAIKVNGCCNMNDDSFIDTRYPSVIVIDDLMRDATNSKDVCELFVDELYIVY